jgi:7,8-dihydro-6-hydroxymethylpterin-pyrophosphokinase
MAPSSGFGQVAAIALGSNLGDSFHNIELALRLLETPEQLLSPKERGDIGGSLFVTVIDTSFLYETPPMYVTDQPPFINCACLVRFRTFLTRRHSDFRPFVHRSKLTSRLSIS